MIQLKVSRTALEAVSLFAGENITRFVICTVCIEYTPDSVILIATDGRMLAAMRLKEGSDFDMDCGYQINEGKTAGSILVPRDAIREAVRMAKPSAEMPDPFQAIEIQIEDNQVGLRFGDWELRCVPVSGKYPNWRGVMPKLPLAELQGCCYNAKYLTRLCDAARIFTSRDNAAVTLFSTANPDGGDARPLTAFIEQAPTFIAQLMPFLPMNGATVKLVPEWATTPNV